MFLVHRRRLRKPIHRQRNHPLGSEMARSVSSKREQSSNSRCVPDNAAQPSSIFVGLPLRDRGRDDITRKGLQRMVQDAPLSSSLAKKAAIGPRKCSGLHERS